MEIYYNGNIFDQNYNIHQAMVIDQGIFIYVGNTEKAFQYNGIKIDLDGKYVLPGFNDSHLHLVGYGQSLHYLPLAEYTSSLQELLDFIETTIANTEEGEWVIGRGWNHDYFQDEQRFPTRSDLDAISTTHPICLKRACGHVMVVNSKAIEETKLVGKEVDGGSYDLERGLLQENAIDLVEHSIPKPTIEDIKKYILLAQEELHQFGITSVQTDDLVSVTKNYQDVLDAYQQLQKENKLTIRVYQQSQLKTLKELEGYVEKGYITGVGNATFKYGPLKVLGDGSLGARTAYLSTTYNDDKTEQGIPVYSKEKLYQMFSYAHTHKMQIAIHSIGDGILDWILDIYEQILNESPYDNHRHGIVHCQVTRKDQLKRIKKLKLHVYIQSIFLDYDNSIIYQRVPKEIADTSYAFKTLGNQTTISNGSDAPVEVPDVLKGLQLAITRTSIENNVSHQVNEGMTIQQALDSFTKGGAYASFEENSKGSIKEGMYADFIVIDKNIVEIEPDKIKDIKILSTYVNGKCVYNKEIEDE